MNRTPQPSDAELILKLYDLRREPVMRKARDWFMGFAPKTIEDVKPVLAADHPQNAFFRQVTSYWEMASSFVNRGVLHPELYADNCGEAMFVFAKLEPMLKELRAAYSPTALAQTERAITEHTAIREKYGVIRERVRTRK